MKVTISRIKSLKKEIDAIVAGVVDQAKSAGFDVDSTEFKKKLATKTKTLMATAGLTEAQLTLLREYELKEVDRLAAEVEDENAKNEIASKIEEENFKKEIKSKTAEIEPIKKRISALEAKKPDWDEIENIPHLFGQEDIENLPYDKLKHPDTDHKMFKAVTKQIKALEGQQDGIKTTIGKVTDALIKVDKKSIKHSDLQGVTKDQHHKEKHTLESHTSSELMAQLERLVGGGIVDDLHKHTFKRGNNNGGGIDQSAADARYIQGIGTRRITVGTTAPTDAVEGDIFIDIS